MSSAEDRPRDEAGLTALDRMMRFGTALFAVKKDELPKRDERAKKPKAKRPRGEAAGS
jgi:hypothetical protein